MLMQLSTVKFQQVVRLEETYDLCTFKSHPSGAT